MKMVVGVQFFLAGKCRHLSFNTQIKNIKKYIFFVQSFALLALILTYLYNLEAVNNLL